MNPPNTDTKGHRRQSTKAVTQCPFPFSAIPVPLPTFKPKAEGTGMAPAQAGVLAGETQPLTEYKVLQDLLQHFLQDLRVGDGVQQPPFLWLGEDNVSKSLTIYLAILQEDLSAKVLQDLLMGLGVGLHH